jgi:hypothetical protein
MLSPASAAAALAASAAHWGRRVVGVQLRQVQAHVAPTDVDVNAGVQWLDEAVFASQARGGNVGGGAGGNDGAAEAGKSKGAGSYLLRWGLCTLNSFDPQPIAYNLSSEKPVSNFAFQMQPAALHRGRSSSLAPWWGCTSCMQLTHSLIA